MSEQDKEERTEKPIRDLPAEKDVKGGGRGIAGDTKGDTKGIGKIEPPEGPSLA